MEKILIVDPDKCTGCGICELVCSFHHFKQFNPYRSSIYVIREDEKGIGIPIVCQHCDIPFCKEACPAGALIVDEKTGAIKVDKNRCVGCRYCIISCPFGGLSIDPLTMAVLKCDLCDGDPQCVKFCPREAISYLPADRVNYIKKKAGAEKLSELFEVLVYRRSG
ncbi:MAG: 4Fe-4S dicluster domain-containing protein [Candidatus Bathyarchaeia archaeon]